MSMTGRRSMSMATPARVLTTLCISLMLQACAGHGDGTFPDPEDAYMTGGTLESARPIKTIQAGLTKDQVRDLLGNPHFSEGLFNVHTWNYLFDFGAKGKHEPMMCQYQLSFDDQMRVEDTRWRTARCALRFAQIEVNPIEGVGQPQYYLLPVDVAFTHQGALSEEGKVLLDEFLQLVQRDFPGARLAIASFPESGQLRDHRLAVRDAIISRGQPTVEEVALSDEPITPCRNDGEVSGCPSTQQIIIEISQS